MSPEDLMKQVNLSLKVGEKQRAVFMTLNSPLAEQIQNRRAICDALDELIAHMVATGADGLRGSVEMAVNEYGTLGSLQASRGDHAAARDAFDRGSDHARAHGDAALMARISVDKAFFLQQAGLYAPAIAAFFSARDALLADPPPPGEQIDPILKVGNATAQTFRWLGDFERCAVLIDQMRQRLGSMQPTSSEPLHSLFVRHRAINLANESMMLALDRAERASGAEREALLDEAQAALESLLPYYDGLGAKAALRMQEIRILSLRGEPAAALAVLDSLVPAFDGEPALAQKRGTVHVRRARLLLDLGRARDALADAEAGVAGEEAYGQRDTLWNAYWTLARARRACAMPGPAFESFDQGVAALNQIRTASVGFRLDNLALRASRPMVDEAVACAAEQDDAGRASLYADAVKSRFLTLSLIAGRPPEPDPRDVARLDQLGMAIDRFVSVGGQTADEADTLIAERAELVERMRLRAGAESAGRAAPFALDATFARLAAGRQAALQLFLAGDALTAVLLKDSVATVRTHQLPAATMTALEGYEQNLSRPPHEQYDRDYDPRQWGLCVEALLPPGLIDHAVSADALLICPHGRLNLLPWPAMPIGTQRLFERIPVATLPNLACVVPLAGRPLGSGRAALLGAPRPTSGAHRLPETETEIDDLAVLYRDRLVTPPKRGDDARLDGFRSLIAHPDSTGATLHVACHGVFLHNDPAGAALVLSDRLLTAAEIALRPLPFAEVTLSACSTGVRPTRIADIEMLGDDLVGLPASFLEAGASVVLNSITPTRPGASAALFTGYHRRRLQGMLPLTAFAATQRELLRTRAHPLAGWIGFSLIAVR